MKEEYNKVILCFLVFFTLIYIGYPAVLQTNDFQFHFNLPKGKCIYEDKQYCDNYYLVSKILNFPSEFSQYFILGFLFLVIFPYLICKDFKETLIYFSLVFSYNIFRSSIYPQGYGLFLIYLWFSYNLNLLQKIILLLLSLIIHKFLFLFLFLIFLFELNYDYFYKRRFFSL